MSPSVLSVSQVNQYLKGLMDRDELLSALYVRGEISNYKCYPSGHHYFSLSGMENKVKELLTAGEKPANVARFAIDTVVNVVLRATGAATERYPGLPVLCSGGVASNSALRAAMTRVCGALFAQPRYSTDNAMGVAILAHRQWKESRS